MSLFNPYKDMIFDDHFCFLTGDLTTESMPVFPEWLMDEFDLHEEKLTLMENSEMKPVAYKDLRLPCTFEVKEAYEELDKTFKAAYQSGYEAVENLDEEVLFHWSARIVYGLLYLEMVGEWKRHQRIGKKFQISPKLRTRLGNFHLMLQSLVQPLYFGEHKPWTIITFPLKYSADILSYRDDVINLLFQFGVNGFGFIVSFQDNGAVGEKNSELFEKMKGHTLHPVQFEELYARLHYSADLLQYEPRYELEKKGGKNFIKSLPMEELDSDIPVFGWWKDDFYARMLSNYWQVYGIEKGEIMRSQEPMLSYLEQPYTKDFVDPESIDLPY